MAKKPKMCLNNIDTSKLLLKMVLLLFLVMKVSGDELESTHIEETEVMNKTVQDGVEQLPSPFLQNFCKHNVTGKEDHKLVCLQWFEVALDHCDGLLRIGKFQPPKIFAPETADEINSNLSIATSTDSLSTLDCKYLIVRLAQDYVKFEPEFEAKNYRIKSLLAGIFLIVTTIVIGVATIWWNKQKQRTTLRG